MRTGILTGAVFIVMASLAGAQPAPSGTRERGPARMERAPRPNRAALERELGLTPEQSAQLRQLRADERKQAIRRRADLAIARIELDEALRAPTIDEKLVAQRVRAVSELQAAAVRAGADRRLALRKLLTPEQQETLRTFTREGRGERGAAWRGAGRRRAPDGPRAQGPGGPRADAFEPREDALEELAEPGR
jgi:Spy/CpxP family protein refolding chaperone